MKPKSANFLVVSAYAFSAGASGLGTMVVTVAMMYWVNRYVNKKNKKGVVPIIKEEMLVGFQ